MNELILNTNTIKNKIYTIRNMQVMLDRDLAELYDVETRVLNQAVKRNLKRFPEDFMFQLSKEEIKNWKSQIVITNKENMGLRRKPYAFTEHGVANLASILTSDKAIEVNVQIMRAFISMRQFILKNAELFNRLDYIEKQQLTFEIKTENNFEKVFTAIEDKSFQKKQGIFFNGQIFDAYTFVSDIIRSAEKSIILIDNYIDDSVLTLLNQRRNNVSVTIFTKEISDQLLLDVKKYNAQYPYIELKLFKDSHDRFLIIDNSKVYHFGASLKDLGKKWFGFCRFDKEVFGLMDRLGIG
ncbi:MAG: ORF6N domain-containing protein [Candidatus Woesearchaeota archaeon]|jgi:hypothetical protein